MLCCFYHLHASSLEQQQHTNNAAPTACSSAPDLGAPVRGPGQPQPPQSQQHYNTFSSTLPHAFTPTINAKAVLALAPHKAASRLPLPNLPPKTAPAPTPILHPPPPPLPPLSTSLLATPAGLSGPLALSLLPSSLHPAAPSATRSPRTTAASTASMAR